MEQITPKVLDKILKVLRDHSVQKFCGGGIEVCFAATPGRIETATPQPSAAPVLQEAEALPPDLRSDAINSYDAVMNWSASPDQLDPELPGTGEDPL